ncbi:response regulator [Pseudorhodoferax sp. Leaf267]|uniref:response regulator n=1 Tax=Pseudorhodoferax sp. Leaf267 TaxID=1736316 RepID=UPI00138F916D|nr:response regulator [Pseudorhodoferax sp. Leaf267]
MSLSLFHCPGSIAFLDDDADYLQMLSLMLPDAWHVRLFVRAGDCLAQLQPESAQWEADAWTQQQIIDRWRQGATPLVPQVLQYWAGHAHSRYAMTHACVADYSMPDMNGLQVLAELSDWPGLRVLLTGQADEQIAVQAFNRALIDQFLPKQAADVAERLLSVLRSMPSNASARGSQIWRATLNPVQHAQLRAPAVAHALQAQIAAHGLVEHVVLGDPFGVLGRTADGAVGWLQLEPVDGLEELEALAETVGTDAATLQEIRSGRQLIDLELRQALGRDDLPQLRPAFAIGDDALLGAYFPIDAALVPDVATSYAAWLAQQPARAVRR